MINKKKKIALVGAFDRFNFGDLLFTYVIENTFNLVSSQDSFVYDYYAMSGNDLRNIGGVKSNPIKEIYRRYREYDAVIVVGGDVLSSTWYSMYSNLDDKNILLFKILHKLFPNKTNYLCKKLLNGENEFPWLLSNCETNLFYNAVGGTEQNNNKFKSEIKHLINKSKCFSVRDIKTNSFLNNDDVILIPDTAILLSKYLNKVNLKAPFLVEENYVVFQCNKKIGDKYFDEIVKQLNDFYEKTKLKILLLPIGLANGHDDLVILKKIHSHLKNSSMLPKINDIYQITFILMNSKAYIGSSLHGSIISLSYEVPSAGLSFEISKQKYFYKTWSVPTVRDFIPEKICENYIELISIDKNILRNKKVELQEKSFEHLEKMAREIINE